jgi:hypothetical protein
MMSVVRTACAVVSATAITATALAGIADPADATAQSAFVPSLPMAGAWEVTQTVTGTPRRQDPRTRTLCVTSPTDAASLTRIVEPSGPGGACQVSGLVIEAASATYSAACPGPFGTLNSNWQARFGADSIAARGQASMMGRNLAMAIDARRTGDCAATATTN